MKIKIRLQLALTYDQVNITQAIWTITSYLDLIVVKSWSSMLQFCKSSFRGHRQRRAENDIEVKNESETPITQEQESEVKCIGKEAYIKNY